MHAPGPGFVLPEAEFSAEREKTLIAFCVMGGIFGEGIDLKKEQLIGAVIVGTGLPQISNEREILMDYYEKRMGEGFDYAYRYPGMNKVPFVFLHKYLVSLLYSIVQKRAR